MKKNKKEPGVPTIKKIGTSRKNKENEEIEIQTQRDKRIQIETIKKERKYKESQVVKKEKRETKYKNIVDG